ncbi:TPA: phage protein NinX family protein [Citrobacter freundii]|nr:DUF2591 domain-containing protein [Citrobacter freundii]
MDYSKLSDHEINVKVGSVIGFTAKLMAVNKQTDYCNNPADAWPIIVERKINIEWHEWKNGEWMPYALNSATTKSCYGTNPLRSAMIVFLMMQESANVQDNPSR